MLRDFPPLPRRGSSTAPFDLLSPAMVAGDTDTHEEASTSADALDDIFGSAPTSPSLAPANSRDDEDNDDDILAARPPRAAAASAQHPSDIPRLRSIHVTNGYRDGVAVSKEAHVQAGFDEGYGLGGELGLRAGWVLGVLEGVCAGRVRGMKAAERVEGAKGGEELSVVRGAQEALASARADLRAERLLDAEFFAPDGVWRYEVPGQLGDADDHGHGDGEIQVSFSEVAACHPLLRKWRDAAVEMAGRCGVEVAVQDAG